MARRSLLPLAAVLAAGALLTACTDAEEPQAPTSPPPASTEPSSAAATDEPSTPAATGGSTAAPTSGLQPFPNNTGPVTAEASAGTQLLLVELTSAEHETYDRVVLTFKGEGTPGWRVGYEDNPAAAGSGRPIDTEGDASLVAQVSGLVLPTEGDGQVQPGSRETDLPEIEEVYLEGWFEGEVQLVLGVDSPDAPFRVFALTDPVRVVIDVQHTDD